MLSDYLNKLPQGSIIAAAISDAITPNSEISEATFTALAAFGVQKMRQRNFRDSYAVIGVKGGDAVESYATSGAPSALITREFLNGRRPGNLVLQRKSLTFLFRQRLQLQNPISIWRLEWRHALICSF